ncbi:hypothetical protein SAMN04488543_1846 [Friedmanniella luteola]|uniref:Uncharacterized protein n=1 Tax=Friedmanniella luteola TaxID=546871 RepID=A0A1H1SQ18_9ACTN|nr:hypothetical protein [Friedmanniella luteola]SDS50001.1 hypothetical protein SAMN04488543_1846 [Friedmanniella luteola]
MSLLPVRVLGLGAAAVPALAAASVVTLPVHRPLSTRPRPARVVPRPVVATGHPHGDGPLSSAPAAPLVVVLLGMFVVAAGLLTGAVLLVVHLLGLLLG